MTKDFCHVEQGYTSQWCWDSSNGVGRRVEWRDMIKIT